MEKDKLPSRWRRKVFEREVLITASKLEKGQLSIAPSFRLGKSLTSIRRLPNGRVNLLTVDGIVRSAMMVIVDRDGE